MKSEKLIADVYNAIRSNTELWNSTLLVITYDEHAGFYDRVEPPAAMPPDKHRYINKEKKLEFSFDRLGLRVPAILVSPGINRGVVNTVFNHTSLLKFLADKWNLGPLGNQTINANALASEITPMKVPRTDTISFIRVPNSLLISKNTEIERTSKNKSQAGFSEFSNFLNKEHEGSMVTSLSRQKMKLRKSK